MAEISIKWTNLSQVIDKLGNYGSQAQEAESLAVTNASKRLRDVAVLFAQGGHPDNPNVITGELSGKMTYDVRTEGKSTIGRAGSPTEYAPHVEYGHMSRSWGSDKWHHVPAYPFLRPAITQVFDGGEANQLLRLAVKEVLGK